MKFERLCRTELAALQITVNFPRVSADKLRDLFTKLQEVSSEHSADIVFQQDNLARWTRRLVVFDVDSTLIQQDVFEEVAKAAGVETEVEEDPEGAIGDNMFSKGLKARVALIKGQHSKELFAKVNRNLVFTPGAKSVCSVLKQFGYKLACLSDGFLPVALEVQRVLGLDYAFANDLEVDTESGQLTGETTGPLVTPKRKRALLAMLANVEGCDVSQTIAVGDNAYDSPMLGAAGLGISCCAKMKVEKTAQVHITQKDLRCVLYFLGISALNLGIDV